MRRSDDSSACGVNAVQKNLFVIDDILKRNVVFQINNLEKFLWSFRTVDET